MGGESSRVLRGATEIMEYLRLTRNAFEYWKDHKVKPIPMVKVANQWWADKENLDNYFKLITGVQRDLDTT